MDQEFKGLIASVEDAFGFVIPEEDAREFHTVGGLYDYILAHRYAGNRDTCLNAIVFYKLRRGMMWALKVEREDILASQNVAALIPWHRYRAWQSLQKAIGLRLPLLRRPAWVMTGAVLATFAFAIAVPWSLSFGFFNGAILVGLLTSYAAAHCLSWLTIPLAIELQPDCTTVGQLVVATLARNYRAVVEEADRPTSNGDVWNLLRTLVAEHRGIQPPKITRETDLRRNLIAV
jgi:hypothetical protein